MNRKTVFLMAGSIVFGAGSTYVGMNILEQPNTIEHVQASTPAQQDAKLTKIGQAYNLIKSRYVEDVPDDKLVQGAIEGMIQTLKDPFSTYMDKATSEEFTQSLSSSFEGIGAEVGMINNQVTIVSPFKNSPAEKVGLKPNDQILKIDGKSIEGLTIHEAVIKIRGKKGSTVKLDIMRPGEKDVLNFQVTRDTIPLQSVYDSVKTYNGKKVGYLDITSFSGETAEEFDKSLKTLEAKKIDGLVIDVRGNPGGYLQSVEKILQGFITKDKPMVQIEARNGEKDKDFSKLTKKKPYPIVVLIDGGSASASEILAGAMKEAGGYKLVGQKTFGKGTVQQTIDMSDGSNIKLTQFKWLTPDGNWIHKKGIEPTVAVNQPAYFHSTPIKMDKTWKYDMNDEQIHNIQVMLKGLGFKVDREDGYFSSQTETAVKEFQTKSKLKVTGQVDTTTAKQLETQVVNAVRDEKNDLQLKSAMEQLFK